MDHRVELRFPDAVDGEPAVLDVTFPAAEWATLQLFVECVTELNGSSPMRKGLHVHIELRGDETGLRSDQTVPSDEDIKLLLHYARALILEKEPTSVPRVIGLLRPRLGHPRLRAFVDKQGQLFSSRAFQAQIRLSVGTLASKSGQLEDEKVLNSDQVFQDWLNAYEYHREIERRERLENLCPVLPSTTVRAFCLSLLLDKISAAFHLARLIRGLGTSGELRLHDVPRAPTPSSRDDQGGDR